MGQNLNAQGERYSFTCLYQEKSLKSKPNVLLPETNKNQCKPKAYRGKEIKIKAEINGMENRKNNSEN